MGIEGKKMENGMERKGGAERKEKRKGRILYKISVLNKSNFMSFAGLVQRTQDMFYRKFIGYIVCITGNVGINALLEGLIVPKFYCCRQL